jgi:hypothetical protein
MWLVAAASGSEFHAGPSQAMHWISLEGEGAVVSVLSERVPQRRAQARGGRRRRAQAQARGHLHVGPAVATHQTTII